MSEFKEFKVGDKVVLVGIGTKSLLLEIVEHGYTPNMHRVKIIATGQHGPVFKTDIRHAAPEEIATGHRIDNDLGDDFPLENRISPLCKVKDQKLESEFEFTQCNDCGYASTSSADCCIQCGSFNTFKNAVSYEEWIRDY